ncbi:MAG: hypothetical protein ACAI44_08385 [Candidatus Sericytochromatia bacterium]
MAEMAEEERLLESFRALEAQERKSLVDFAGVLSERRRPTAGSEQRHSFQNPVRERSDLGRYRWEQSGL